MCFGNFSRARRYAKRHASMRQANRNTKRSVHLEWSILFQSFPTESICLNQLPSQAERLPPIVLCFRLAASIRKRASTGSFVPGRKLRPCVPAGGSGLLVQAKLG